MKKILLTFILISSFLLAHSQTQQTVKGEQLTFEKLLLYRTYTNPLILPGMTSMFQFQIDTYSYNTKEVFPIVNTIASFNRNDMQLNVEPSASFVFPKMKYKKPVSKMYYLDMDGSLYYRNILGWKIRERQY